MEPLGKYVKIEVNLPKEYTDALREALNDAGLLTEGAYDHVLGIQSVTGYWRPLEGADPHDGNIGEISCETEAKVEFRCRREQMQRAAEVIRAVHPYEEPLIQAIPLIDL